MEMHGNFHPHLQQKWMVREYPMVWSITYVHIKGAFHRGAKCVTFPYIWDQSQGNDKGHLDILLLIIYRAMPEE